MRPRERGGQWGVKKILRLVLGFSTLAIRNYVRATFAFDAVVGWSIRLGRKRDAAGAGASMCCAFICVRHPPGPPEGPGRPRKARFKAETLLSNIACDY
jgi:hypothetical protein